MRDFLLSLAVGAIVLCGACAAYQAGDPGKQSGIVGDLTHSGHEYASSCDPKYKVQCRTIVTTSRRNPVHPSRGRYARAVSGAGSFAIAGQNPLGQAWSDQRVLSSWNMAPLQPQPLQ